MLKESTACLELHTREPKKNSDVNKQGDMKGMAITTRGNFTSSFSKLVIFYYIHFFR
jgi:hypothetical protein